MKQAASSGFTVGWGTALLAVAAVLSLLLDSAGCGARLSPRAKCSAGGQVTTGGECSNDADCAACSAPATPVCNVATSTCVECVNAAQCGNGNDCNASTNTCVYGTCNDPLQGCGPPGGLACATPTFAPAAGTVAAGTTVILTAAGLPANGFIYYTTDQTMPTHASAFVASGGTVTVSQTETITAIAYAMGACSDSAVATATYEVATCEGTAPALPGCGPPPACAAPTFMPAAGALVLGTTVTIVPPANFPTSFPQGNGTIYYTVDGTIPTHASPAYSGPIQINGAETIHAIASDPGVCTDSTAALASFTVVPVSTCDNPLQGCDPFPPPALNPPSTTQSKDFLVEIADANPAVTICFTFGAAIPTCMVTATSATCTGTSETYVVGAGLGASGSVTINGGVTSAAGTVVVNVIACEPGNLSSPVVSQTYTLQAATPTMQGPAPSPTLPYQAGGYMPTLSSLTAGATLSYTTDGSTPTCAADMLDAGLFDAGNLDTVPTLANATYNAVACKPGYAPSVQATFTYGIVLPPPGFVNSASTTTPEGTGTYDGALSIDFSSPPTFTGTSQASGLLVCYTTDGSAPTCGTTAGTCGHGTADNVVGSMPTAVPITATGTSVNAVACSPSYNASAVATATYTLQLEAATDATTE